MNEEPRARRPGGIQKENGSTGTFVPALWTGRGPRTIAEEIAPCTVNRVRARHSATAPLALGTTPLAAADHYDAHVSASDWHQLFEDGAALRV
jgi:hypothetical protein